MTASFIITLDVSDTTPGTLEAEAAVVQEACEAAGLAVVSVAPWARQSTGPALPALSDSFTQLQP